MTMLAAARQRCPALPYTLSMTILVVMSTSASGRTITGFLAPPCACTRLPLAEARAYTWRATGVEPTNVIALING